MHDTPEAIAITNKSAQNLMISELLQVCTPAPWRKTMYGGISDRNGSEIRATGLTLTNSEVAKNNSQLIALAPTIAAELIKERELNAVLLEALKELLQTAEYAYNNYPELSGRWKAGDDMRRASAAIKKAEGVQP